MGGSDESATTMDEEYAEYVKRMAYFRPEDLPMTRADFDAAVAQWEPAWEAQDANTIHALEWALCL